MAKIWEEYRGYRPCRWHVNNSTRGCFSSIQREGLENIPRDGAVLLAANHCATLMDPLLQMQIPGPIGFGARSDIFKNPKTARLLRWMRIVPLARERNGLAEVAKNFEVFKEIIDCLEFGSASAAMLVAIHACSQDMPNVQQVQDFIKAEKEEYGEMVARV